MISRRRFGVLKSAPNLRRLAVARFTSVFGSAFGPIALSFGVLQMPGGSPAALSLVGGTTLSAMQGVLCGRQTWRDAGEQVAELVLKALGLPLAEAHAIATTELPALAPPIRTRSTSRSGKRSV